MCYFVGMLIPVFGQTGFRFYWPS